MRTTKKDDFWALAKKIQERNRGVLHEEIDAAIEKALAEVRFEKEERGVAGRKSKRGPSQ